MKLRFKGLSKKTDRILSLFVLSNLWMARKRLLAMTGELRLKAASRGATAVHMVSAQISWFL
jgi:IS5 family transposase